MPSCYILYSQSLKKYYVGCTQTDLVVRIARHNTGYFGKHFTAQADDWESYLELPCDTFKQARRMEVQIKKMKSKKYIENLKRYPEMRNKLYAETGH